MFTSSESQTCATKLDSLDIKFEDLFQPVPINSVWNCIVILLNCVNSISRFLIWIYSIDKCGVTFGIMSIQSETDNGIVFDVLNYTSVIDPILTSKVLPQ